MQLRKIQQDLTENLLQPNSALNNDIFQNNPIPLEERFKIYRNNTIGSISNALAATFPLLEKLVGEEFLKSLTRTFVQKHPPKSGCLNLYGNGFEDFIASHAQTQSMPYIGDMAKLELAINNAYYALDDEPLKVQSLKLESILRLRYSVTLIPSPYALLNLRDFCLNPEQSAPDIFGNTYIMVLRPDLEVQIIPLNANEFAFLQNIAEGKSFGECLESALSQNPSFDSAAFLQKHITLGTFQAV